MAAKTDSVLMAAVDLARAAAEAESRPDQVGAWLGASLEGERLVVQRFECLNPAYHGWYWAVLLTRVPRARTATVDDVVLLPGADALLAPAWVPWSERIEPGDVTPGMLMATPDDDPRLIPGYSAGADPKTPSELVEIRSVVRELGLGRNRVLSPEGRDLACVRWTATRGADTPEAKHAPAPCVTCGYFVRLRGGLGVAFGVCANGYAASDGQVVAIDHGCGAHSDVVEERRGVSLPALVWEDATDITSAAVSVFD
ncbi:MAG: DUF3027 domain-containing protein [Propionibacteriaceae bacterium]|nr:DUF3027 domain-containing protein [Propionibacteriaceae bacterium]